ncbi:hypothetical protein GCM10027514_00840 [Azotobacter armeniacus]
MRKQGVCRTVVREALSRLQASGLAGNFVLEHREQAPLRLDVGTALGARHS